MEVKEQCVVLMRNGAGFACIGNRSSPAWMGLLEVDEILIDGKPLKLSHHQHRRHLRDDLFNLPGCIYRDLVLSWVARRMRSGRELRA